MNLINQLNRLIAHLRYILIHLSEHGIAINDKFDVDEDHVLQMDSSEEFSLSTLFRGGLGLS